MSICSKVFGFLDGSADENDCVNCKDIIETQRRLAESILADKTPPKVMDKCYNDLHKLKLEQTHNTYQDLFTGETEKSRSFLKGLFG